MRIIKLNVNDKVYEKFIWLLSKFSKEEVEIISDNVDYLANKEYLQKELDEPSHNQICATSICDFM
jgi:hypothetical protein